MRAGNFLEKENNMKKLALILAIVMVFSFVMTGCGSTNNETAVTETKVDATDETPAVAADDAGEASGEASGEAADSTVEAESISGGKVLRVILSAEPGSINPLTVTSAGDCNYIAQCMYDTLVAYNSETGALEPSVATAWEWIDDTHLQLTLRDDVIASDGSTFTASDVYYTIQCGVNGDAQSNWQYVDIDECSVVDDQTIIIGMTEIHPTYVSLLANIMYVPLVDESAVEANGGWEACARAPLCTTGPYLFNEWVDGEYIRLVKNENYWGEEPYYDELIFSWVSDSTSRTMAIAAGDADIAVEIGSTDYNSLDSYGNCVGYVTPASGTYCLFLNTENEYLKNDLVREAIACAINAEALRQVGAAGLGDLSDSVLPASSTYYFAAGDDFTHETDVARAKELLEQAGYPNGFEMNFPIPSFNQIEGEVIQACLGEIGITVKLDVIDFFSYLTISDTGAYDLAWQATTPTDVTTVLGYFDNRMAQNLRFGGIVGGFDDLNEILDICRYSTNDTELMQGWSDFQDYIRDNHLVVPCYAKSFFYAADAEYDMLYSIDGNINIASVTPAK